MIIANKGIRLGYNITGKKNVCLLKLTFAHKGVGEIDLGNSLPEEGKTQTHQLAAGSVDDVTEPTSRLGFSYKRYAYSNSSVSGN